MKLVDTHCHLHRQEFDLDRESVIRRAAQAGVAVLLDPATDFPSNRTVTALAKETPQVYAAVGVHPHDAAQLTPEGLKELARLAAQEKVVAIGEIGLDYYRDICPREVQKEALRRMLRLARELGKPVILHCREEEKVSAGPVYEELFSILQECLDLPIRGLLHCFAGTAEVAQEALRMGLDISFAGNLTFPKASHLRAVAQTVPIDRIVLETDAPFLAPQPYRGKRNEPAYLAELVGTWAQIRGITPEEVAETTTANVRRLFGIG